MDAVAAAGGPALSKKEKAMNVVLALTRGQDTFTGKPMRDFVNLADATRLCSCRSNPKKGAGYDDTPWVYCDRDDTRLTRPKCFGYRCYHLNCIPANIRPAVGEDGNVALEAEFVCTFCKAEDERKFGRS